MPRTSLPLRFARGLRLRVNSAKYLLAHRDRPFASRRRDKSFPVLLVKTHKKENEMRAIVVSEFGGPEVLSVREVPAPKPGPGQVAIRVAYAGVNYAETMARRGGLHSGLLPFIPGLEVAGYIHALGEGVEG